MACRNERVVRIQVELLIYNSDDCISDAVVSREETKVSLNSRWSGNTGRRIVNKGKNKVCLRAWVNGGIVIRAMLGFTCDKILKVGAASERCNDLLPAVIACHKSLRVCRDLVDLQMVQHAHAAAD